MTDRPDAKRRRPNDINQLAKSIVELATGNPIVEDPPMGLKKRSLVTRRQGGPEGGSKAHARKRKDGAKRSAEV